VNLEIEVDRAAWHDLPAAEALVREATAAAFARLGIERPCRQGFECDAG
jgi:hypothetical protein